MYENLSKYNSGKSLHAIQVCSLTFLILAVFIVCDLFNITTGLFSAYKTFVFASYGEAKQS